MNRFSGTLLFLLGVLAFSLSVISVVSAQSLQYINFVPQASDPATCNSGTRGGLYFASTTGELKVCNGSWSAIVSNTNYFTLSGNNLYPTSTTYNVGIGTVAPEGKLQVEGDLLFDTTTGDKSIKKKINSSWYDAIKLTTGDITIMGSQGVVLSSTGYGTIAKFDNNAGSYVIGNQYTNPVTFYTKAGLNQTADVFQVRSSNDSKVLIVQPGGNVGIASTTPGYALTVAGTGYFSQPIFVGTPSDSSHAATKGYVDTALIGISSSSQWTATSTGIFYNGGSVGIGTTAPGAGLNIISTKNPQFESRYTDTSAAYIKLFSDAANAGITINKNGGNRGGSVYFNTGTYASNSLAWGVGMSDSDFAGDGTEFYIGQTAGGANANFWIETNGNVGIGKNNPSYKLDVEGTLYTSSTAYLYPNVNGVDAARIGRLSFGNVTNGYGQFGEGFSFSGANYIYRYSDYATKINMGAGFGFDTAPIGTVGNNITFTRRMTITNSGNVGIASTTPGYALTVAGTGYFSQPIFVGTPSDSSHAATKGYVDTALIGISSSSQWTATSTGIFYNGGNIGIGTTNPTNIFEVSKEINHLTDGVGTQAQGIFGGATNSTLQLLVGYDTTNDFGFIQAVNQGSTYNKNLILQGKAGNVGIGTTTPARLLHVNSAANNYIRLQATGADTYAGYELTNDAQGWTTGVNSNDDYVINDGLQFSGDNIVTIQNGAPINTLYIKDNGLVGIGTANPGSNLEVYGTNASLQSIVVKNSGTYGVLMGVNSTQGYFGSNNATAVNLITNNVSRVYISTAGNVGIASTTPGYALTVAGTGYFSQPIFVGTPSDSSHAATKGYVDTALIGISSSSQWTATSTGIFYNGGRVGIGTAVPGTNLPNGWSNDANSRLLEIKTISTAGDAGILISRSDGEAGLNLWEDSSTGRVYIDNMRNDPAANIIFRTKTSGTPIDAVTILGSGNVGIGTTTPSNKLDVVGRIKLSLSNPWIEFFDSVNTAYIGTGDDGVLFTGASADSLAIRATNAMHLGTGGNNIRMTILSNGNIGVGKTNPDALMDINGNSIITGGDAWGLGSVSGVSSAAEGWMMAYDTTNDIAWMKALHNNNAYKPMRIGASNISFWTSAGSLLERMTILVDGKVGIASSTPGYQLTVDGTGYFSGVVHVGTPVSASNAATKAYVDSAVGGGAYWTLVGSTLQTTSSAYDISFGDGSGTDLVVGGGTGKIDVGTVDPVYTIGGTRYATYLPGMTGVKEETTGEISLQGKSPSYTIDFKNLEKGSDLWLFAKTTNLPRNFDRMTILLTPSFEGAAWYEKNPENLTLTIRGAKKGSVSYRLTAPRFDSEIWKNRADDGEHEGFNLDKLIFSDGSVDLNALIR